MVTLQTQFGVQSNVQVGFGAALCAPALKNGQGDLAAPHGRCHQITGPAINQQIDVTTQFGQESALLVGVPQLLCVPAVQVMNPVGTPGPPPTLIPAQPYYTCYQALGADPIGAASFQTKFGLEPSVDIGQGSSLCVATLKNFGGDINTPPPLRCYTAGGTAPSVQVRVWTQFFQPEPDVSVGAPGVLCVPAIKITGGGVGGIAQPPDLTGEGLQTPAASGPSTALLAGAIAGTVAAGSAALSGAAWYVRRRRAVR